MDHDFVELRIDLANPDLPDRNDIAEVRCRLMEGITVRGILVNVSEVGEVTVSARDAQSARTNDRPLSFGPINEQVRHKVEKQLTGLLSELGGRSIR